MGRVVKIWDMGTKGNSDSAYRAPNGRYYSTKAVYDAMVQKNTERQRCIDAIRALLGYEDGMKPNTYIFKLLKEIEPYGYDVIYETIHTKAKDICWAFSKKSFNDETGKIKYMFAIINNSIMDVYKNKQATTEAERKQAEVIEIRDYQRGLEESKTDYNIRGTSGKGRDVSNLLGDE